AIAGNFRNLLLDRNLYVEAGGSMNGGTVTLTQNGGLRLEGGTFTWSGGTFDTTAGGAALSVGYSVDANATFVATGNASTINCSVDVGTGPNGAAGTFNVQTLNGNLVFAKEITVFRGSTMNLTQASGNIRSQFGDGGKHIWNYGTVTFDTAATI